MRGDESIYRTLKSCNNCPFMDNGKKILLNEGRVDDIKNALLRGKTFSCHKTVYNLDENMKSTDEQSPKMCYGAFAFLKKENQPNQIMQLAQRLLNID